MNSRAVRFFVIAEVLVCFVPLAGLLFLGFLFDLFVMADMLEGRFASWRYLVAVACGAAGFVALFQVLKWLFGHQADRLGRWWTLTLMLLGLLPIAVIFAGTAFHALSNPYDDSSWYTMPLLAVPILVTAHLAYLARQYLFPSTESRVNP